MTINEMTIRVLSDFIEIQNKNCELNEKIKEILPHLDNYSQKCLTMAMITMHEALIKWIDFYKEYEEPTYKL